jgi:hypothetical protein
MKIVRSILGVILGFVIGVIVIGVIQMVNGYIHPMPAGLDPFNPEQLKRAFSNLPTTAFVGLLISYFAGVFFAAFAAAKIAGRGEVMHGFIISVLYALIGISNFTAFPAPTWVVAGSFIIYFVAGFLGASFANSLRGAKVAEQV